MITDYVTAGEFESLRQMMTEQNKMLLKISQALEPAFGQKTLFVRVESLEQDQATNNQRFLNINSELVSFLPLKKQVKFLMQWFWTASGAGMVLAVIFESARIFLMSYLKSKGMP